MKLNKIVIFEKSKIVSKLSIFFRDSKIQDEEIRLYLNIIEKLNYCFKYDNQNYNWRSMLKNIFFIAN